MAWCRDPDPVSGPESAAAWIVARTVDGRRPPKTVDRSPFAESASIADRRRPCQTGRIDAQARAASPERSAHATPNGTLACRSVITRTFPSPRAAARAAARAPSWRSTASRAGPTTSPTRATTRRRTRSQVSIATARELDAIEARRHAAPIPHSPHSPRAVAEHRLPLVPTARPASTPFARTWRRRATPTFEALIDYCAPLGQPGRPAAASRSYGRDDDANRAMSDAICTGLQLTNFWQDVAIDWDKGRVYVPLRTSARFGVTEAQIARAPRRRALARADGFETERTRGVVRAGRPLVAHLPWRAGIELAAVDCRRERHPGAHRRGRRRLFRRSADAGHARLDRRRGPGARAAAQEHGTRVMTPDEYCAQQGRPERLELLLQLPVAAAGAPSRHHGALCVLPRGG